MSKTRLKISCETLNSKAIIRIDGYISDWTNHASWFKNQIDVVIANGINDLVVYINSGGGDCFQANEIANELIRFKGTTEAQLGALCASAATYIASKMQRVVAAKNVSYMIHKPIAGIYGNSPEVESVLKNLKNMEEEYAQTYADKTGMSVKKIQDLWVEDYWMNATEAKKLGFIDAIEGEADITDEEIQALAARYKSAPKMEATTQTKPSNQNNTEMKDKILIVLAGMQGLSLTASSTDEQVIAAIEGLKAKALKTDEYKTKLDAAIKQANTDKISSFLAKAVEDKKILASEIGYYTKQMEASFDETKAHIDAKPKLTRLSDKTDETGKGGSGVDTSKWTYADFQEKDPKALAEMAEKDEARFNALFEAHYGK